MSYYNDQDNGQWMLDGPITWDTFTNFVLSRNETSIDFMTGDAEVPPTGVNDTFWSARWEGPLHVPEDGNYTFYLKSLDDGGRLYIDDMGTPVLESWLVQGFHTYQVTVPLTAGPHVIRVEFAQGPPVDYGLIVEWELEESFREKIGPCFTPTVTPTPTPTFTPTATPTPTPTPTLIPTLTPTPRPTHPPTPMAVPPSPPPWWAPAEPSIDAG